MDSEDDDLHDAYQEADEYNSDDGNYESDYNYDFLGDVDHDQANHQWQQQQQQKKNYTILKEEDIRKRQEDGITTVSTVLSISKQNASILLRNFHWSVSRVQDEWFADEDRVRQTVGLLLLLEAEESAVAAKNRPIAKVIKCGICFEPHLRQETHSAPGCDHRYCKTCWGGYLSTSINNDGPGCLLLRCPDPACRAAIDQDMIDILATEEDKRKYSRYLLRSYIEAGNRRTKWCPAPGCDFAVEFDNAGGDGSYDISCLCSHSFCWNCSEESHRPVDCETVSKWLIKNSSESENMNWILVNTKPCPKCKRPIEKSTGCNHMLCSKPCGYRFCWVCLDGLSKHRTSSCNAYQAAERDGTLNEFERRKQRAKQSLERYLHYYERWATNQSSRKKALADLHQMQTVKIVKLGDLQCQSEKQLLFLIEAWQQIVECRRVLKWTYAYGYYLPEHERDRKDFFEYSQGEAESALERLHQCAEKELQDFFGTDGPSEGFNDFRSKLIGLTSVTKTFFKNLVSLLENGLSVSHRAYSQTESSKNLGESSWRATNNS